MTTLESEVLQRISCRQLAEVEPLALSNREWLLTNGLGGYASGTLSGACTRRYHSLLIAALPAPLGRMVMFNHLAEEVKHEDRTIVRLDSLELADSPLEPCPAALIEFRLESGLPVWRYDVGPVKLEKRILLPHLQNTVYINYRLAEGSIGTRLRLRPSFHFRPHDAPVRSDEPPHYAVSAVRHGFEVRPRSIPPLRMCVVAARSNLVLDGGRVRNVQYRLERDRGYEWRGSLWNPGYFRIDLAAGQEATLIASTEEWDLLQGIEPSAAWPAELQRRERLLSLAGPAARSGIGADLVLAADQFIIRPVTRIADAALAHAAGEEAHTVIAGYHWFTDWGRDTMISLEGLTLITGRVAQAGNLLRTFARHVRDGLIPNLFPEGKQEGLYHTADATLWYFHALARYLRASGDHETLQHLLPILRDIVDHHVRGTRFGIHVDPADGLLVQGAPGYQLTWMDAKVGDWVVTPRRGKAVEINALWYNALRHLEGWIRESGDATAADELDRRAAQARDSFNRRFWFADQGYLFDVVDGEQGDDSSPRPNQVFAMSLDHPILEPARWSRVLEVVASRLLTPFGLRSLAPGSPEYKATYDGDLRSRDAAYHQGTVWAWLIGPFIDAWLKVHPGDLDRARDMLTGFAPHLAEACVGTISEIFDAEAPYYPRGCIAQAWSVAEVLRSWVATATDQNQEMPNRSIEIGPA
ncbi:MAG TPA: amylo-alpha-1,6-glucosidase [Planctomycetaceae bacterium]|nr:amylo-alpha-1,6-glucosidase [Planctomycetaceae bacterium]